MIYVATLGCGGWSKVLACTATYWSLAQNLIIAMKESNYQYYYELLVTRPKTSWRSNKALLNTLSMQRLLYISPCPLLGIPLCTLSLSLGPLLSCYHGNVWLNESCPPLHPVKVNKETTHRAGPPGWPATLLLSDDKCHSSCLSLTPVAACCCIWDINPHSWIDMAMVRHRTCLQHFQWV